MPEESNKNQHLLFQLLSVIQKDKRLSPSHFSIYCAFLTLWFKNNCVSPFRITRHSVMEIAMVRSIATYHKSIKELAYFGYIEYSPSYNPALGSTVCIHLEAFVL
jgi:hypothetical protein